MATDPDEPGVEAASINPPSQWAVPFTVTEQDGVKTLCCWDYVEDNFFAWTKGVFMFVQDDSTETGWRREAGVDQYPEAQEPDPVGRLINDCRNRFNAKIAELFDIAPGLPDHPVDQEVYEALTAGLVWNPNQNQFV